MASCLWLAFNIYDRHIISLRVGFDCGLGALYTAFGYDSYEKI